MPVVIAIPGNEAHAHKLGERLGVEVIAPELRRFPDGEIYVRIDRTGASSIDAAVLVGSLYPDPAAKFLELAFLASLARDLGAKRVGLVAPYLAFMRQDVQFKPGEGVTSRRTSRGWCRASSTGWSRSTRTCIVTRRSRGSIRSRRRSRERRRRSRSWIRREVEHPVLVRSGYAESVQWVSAIADACGAPFVILEKTRRGDRDVSVSEPHCEELVSASRTPVLIDDIVSTGKTMVAATRQLRAAGTAPPMCVAIHAVFADSVETELVSAGAAGIITCDTIVHASNRICVADPIAEATRRLL